MYEKSVLRPTDMFSGNYLDSGIVGFSLVRASNESLAGIKGTVILENVFTDLNGAWDKDASMFKCKLPGLYFFNFNARGTVNNTTDFWQ